MVKNRGSMFPGDIAAGGFLFQLFQRPEHRLESMAEGEIDAAFADDRMGAGL